MRLILMRHGSSPSLAEAGVERDEDRPLSKAGEKQAFAAGAALRKKGMRPAKVLASPFLRARRTAERAVEGLGGGIPVELFQPLESGALPEKLSQALKPFDGHDCLLLVGHQPDLGAFAGFLLSDGGLHDLKPGGMLLIELGVKDGPALRWVLRPDEIEKLA